MSAWPAMSACLTHFGPANPRAHPVISIAFFPLFPYQSHTQVHAINPPTPPVRPAIIPSFCLSPPDRHPSSSRLCVFILFILCFSISFHHHPFMSSWQWFRLRSPPQVLSPNSHLPYVVVAASQFRSFLFQLAELDAITFPLFIDSQEQQPQELLGIVESFNSGIGKHPVPSSSFLLLFPCWLIRDSKWGIWIMIEDVEKGACQCAKGPPLETIQCASNCTVFQECY